MTDKAAKKSSERSRLAKLFLGAGKNPWRIFIQVTPIGVVVGIGIPLLLALLVAGWEFQSIPEYQIGDIADRTIEAPLDFTVEDREATQAKQEEARATVRPVFDFDVRVNNRVAAELRAAVAEARRLVSEEGEPGPRGRSPATTARLLSQLRERLPRFTQDGVLEIGLEHSFSPDLENQMVALLQEAMKAPGVVLSRDILLRYQEQGITLRNTITGQDELLNDLLSLRDLGQARDLLRQNEYQLTAVEGVQKKEIITFLEGWVVPNVYHNESASSAREQLVMQEVLPVLVQIKKGRILVRAGDEIKFREKVLLEQLRSLQQPRRWLGKFIGIFLLVGFFMFAIWHYLYTYRIRRKQLEKHYLLMAFVLVLSLAVTRVFMAFAELVASVQALEGLRDPVNLYFLAPLTLGAILLILLVEVQIPILHSLIFSVFVGLLSEQTTLFVYTLVGSLTAIYLMDHYRDRAAIIKGGFIIGLANVATILSLQLFASDDSFQWIVFSVRAGAGILSGLFAAMMAFLFLPILESVFKITTDIRLLELSNLNNPILRRMAVEAPGTYHHSIIVGTLAESAAEAIGANALLARVGAYYHDIGKLKNAEYYVENQMFISNKHENLTPSMSSLILASHVKDGLAMAEQMKLIDEVRDLIPQHHGTRLMKYFYQKAKDAQGKGGTVHEDDFRYPGPRPQTRVAAILMLADQVEAAARTLQDPSPGQIRSMIRRLIQDTIQDGQFDQCDITMKDLNKISRAFERVIGGIHHHRIEYPGFDFNQRDDKKQLEHTQATSPRIQ